MRFRQSMKKVPAVVIISAVVGTTLLGCSTGHSGITTTTIGTVPDSTLNLPHTTSAPSTVTDTVPTVDELIAEVQGKFQQDSYSDTQSGKRITYNVFLPEGYQDTKQYPLVVYIPDSSLVGQDSTAYLSQYGALIWASAEQQKEHEAIVVVPQYEEKIIDDNNNTTMVSDYVDATGRMIAWLQTKYSVDESRVYGTGQSMGCMTVMYLAAQIPNLFAAVLLVSGQWDTTDLSGLVDNRMLYIAAAGDEKAAQGQQQVKNMFTEERVEFAEADKQWDATWPMSEQNAAAEDLFSQASPLNFATFAKGTVTTVNPVATSEHMASFEPAYRIPAVREWLLSQHKVEVLDNSTEET